MRWGKNMTSPATICLPAPLPMRREVLRGQILLPATPAGPLCIHGPAVTQSSVCVQPHFVRHLNPSANAPGGLVCDGLHLFIGVVPKHHPEEPPLPWAVPVLCTCWCDTQNHSTRAKQLWCKWEQNSASGLQSHCEGCCSQCCRSASGLD